MIPAAVHIRRWRDDPVAFVREVFKAEPDAWQIDVLEAYAHPDKRRISLQACAGPGKTAILAWCAWHFLLCRGEKGEHPKGAAVSITSDNLKDNLWPELAKWQSRSPLLLHLFEWNKERLFAKDHPETWFLSARSWPKTANAEEQGRTLSGLHAKFVLVLIDESGEIPISVLNAGDQALGNCQWGKMIQAGNPTSLDGMLHAATSLLAHMWTVIRITGDPEDPKRSPRIPVEWAKAQIAAYGRDNPWVMSYILGLFPPSSINALLGADEVRTAMGKHLRENEYSYAQKRIGIDCARFGDDRTIIFPRQGLASFATVELRNATGPDTAARAAVARDRWGWEIAMVDDTGGYGASAIDAMNLAGMSVMPVNFSGKAIDSRYFNKRSEMWFEMAKWVRAGGALPEDADLARELTTPTYTFHNGKFRLEEKDQIKKRLGFSPDKADALALTFAIPDMPAGTIEGKLMGIKLDQHPRVLHDWNPLEAVEAAA